MDDGNFEKSYELAEKRNVMGFGEYLPKQKTEYTVKTEPVQMQPQQADGNAFPITEEVRTDEKVRCWGQKVHPFELTVTIMKDI